MSTGPRFLTLTDVAEVLNTSLAQVTALVKREELKALKLGGRGQWRVEASELEAFIERMYAETHAHLRGKADPSHRTIRGGRPRGPGSRHPRGGRTRPGSTGPGAGAQRRVSAARAVKGTSSTSPGSGRARSSAGRTSTKSEPTRANRP